MSQNTEFERPDVDADILLITEYFGRALTPSEAAEVEGRIVDDDEFFAKVGLLVEATLLQTPVVHAGMRAALAQHRARVAEDLLALRVARSLWPDIDERLAEPMPELILPSKTVRRSVAAIEPSLKAVKNQPRWVRYGGYAWRTVERFAFAAQIIAVIGVGGLAIKVMAGLSAGPQHGRVSTQLPNTRVEVTVARDAASRVVDLPNGARATVMPGSQISFDTAVVHFGTTVMVRLSGEASFEVPSQPISVAVFTRAGAASLTGGDFAVRSSGRGSETLITVRGRAWVTRTNAPDNEWLDVTSGFVRVTRDQKPEVVMEGIDRFPRIPRR